MPMLLVSRMYCPVLRCHQKCGSVIGWAARIKIKAMKAKASSRRVDNISRGPRLVCAEFLTIRSFVLISLDLDSLLLTVSPESPLECARVQSRYSGCLSKQSTYWPLQLRTIVRIPFQKVHGRHFLEGNAAVGFKRVGFRKRRSRSAGWVPRPCAADERDTQRLLLSQGVLTQSGGLVA